MLNLNDDKEKGDGIIVDTINAVVTTASVLFLVYVAYKVIMNWVA